MSAILAACFFACSVVCWLHVRQLVRDKRVKGVSLIPSYVFITTNAVEVVYFWNDPWSAAGAASMLFANSVWLALALIYRRRHSSPPCDQALHD